jgi:DNA-binding response OmpR family regulator
MKESCGNQGQQAVPVLAASASRKFPKVLVVDDVPDSANSLAVMMQLWGYPVVVAYDGLAALELCDTFDPRVVVLDLGMPGFSGFRLARLLKERAGNGMLLIAVTGHDVDEIRSLAADAGIAHFLVKPANPDELQTLLASVTASAQ